MELLNLLNSTTDKSLKGKHHIRAQAERLVILLKIGIQSWQSYVPGL